MSEKPSPDKSRNADEAPHDDTQTGAGKARSGKEIGGPRGPEPTRYGDWEKGGRCIDF